MNVKLSEEIAGITFKAVQRKLVDSEGKLKCFQHLCFVFSQVKKSGFHCSNCCDQRSVFHGTKQFINFQINFELDKFLLDILAFAHDSFYSRLNLIYVVVRLRDQVLCLVFIKLGNDCLSRNL